MISENQWAVINSLFELKRFDALWNVIDSYYTRMFRDDITDVERIAEYTYITQQLNKYISKRKEILISYENIEDMMGQLVVWLGEAQQYASERRELVYGFLRDSWTWEVLSALGDIAEGMENEEPEEEWEDE